MRRIQREQAFEKALEIDPDNGWVKYDLLPDLRKAEKKN